MALDPLLEMKNVSMHIKMDLYLKTSALDVFYFPSVVHIPAKGMILVVPFEANLPQPSRRKNRFNNGCRKRHACDEWLSSHKTCHPAKEIFYRHFAFLLENTSKNPNSSLSSRHTKFEGYDDIVRTHICILVDQIDSRKRVELSKFWE